MISWGLPSRRGVGVAALCTSLVFAMPLDAADAQDAALDAPTRGHVEELRRLDGIPIHRVVVATVPDESIHIHIDGLVDEPEWEGVTPFDNMLVAIPATGKHGRYDTEVRLLATERGLYASAVLHQPRESLVTRRTVRDLFIDRDTFGMTLDPSGVGKFGYWFTIALGDTQLDGKVLPERNYSSDWDGPWIAKTAVCAEGWSAEIFFPWSMMNLPERSGPRTIGFATTRGVSHENARYQWPGHAYSSPQFVSALNQM